jgi:hypothetical protein
MGKGDGPGMPRLLPQGRFGCKRRRFGTASGGSVNSSVDLPFNRL